MRAACQPIYRSRVVRCMSLLLLHDCIQPHTTRFRFQEFQGFEEFAKAASNENRTPSKKSSLLQRLAILRWRRSGQQKNSAKTIPQNSHRCRDEHSQLRCLMVFDTQPKQFVGSGCYVVTGKPSIADVAKVETIRAAVVCQ
jgi:hypothetical protein